MILNKVLPFVHQVITRCVHVGDTAVDATAGHGHDTLLLAQCVGETGQVYAFDIQQEAIESSRQLLLKHDLLTRVHLIHEDHQHIAQYIASPVTAVIFNFGYLPHGDKNITTRVDTSLQALQSASSLLCSSGIITAVLYPGHTMGAQEACAIEHWASTLPQQQFAVLKYNFINWCHNPPYALVIERL